MFFPQLGFALGFLLICASGRVAWATFFAKYTVLQSCGPGSPAGCLTRGGGSPGEASHSGRRFPGRRGLCLFCFAICVLQLCFAVVLCNYVLQLGVAMLFCNCVLRLCCATVCCKWVVQLFFCCAFVFCNCVLQTCSAICVLQLCFAIAFCN